MKNITAVLISFLRPEYTKECVKTLAENYKGIKILVADNSEYNQDLRDFIKGYGGRYIAMPFDSGVCFARNRLVEMADTEYILVGDDDFSYNDGAKVKEMLKFMRAHKEFSLIGGRISEKGKVLDYQGHINIYPDHFEYIKLDPKAIKKCKKSGIKYQKCDITFNYFIARREDIKSVKWDEKIKVAYEHSDWFITLKKRGGRSVAFTPDAVVIHKPENVVLNKETKDRYNGFRNRKQDMFYFFGKHKIKYSLGFRGTRTNFEQAKDLMHKYYAKVAINFGGRSYNKGDIIVTDNPNEWMEPCY